VDCATIKPLDERTIVASAKKTRAVVTAENHSVVGGLGGAIAELLGETCPVPMKRVGIQDRYGESGPLEDLLPKYGLTTDAVFAAALSVLARKEV
jgi:transketolase